MTSERDRMGRDWKGASTLASAAAVWPLAARASPARTAPSATRPSRTVAPKVTSTNPRTIVGTARSAWAGTSPRSRRRERTARAAADTPYWASTAMLDSAKSWDKFPAFTKPVTITQVTARARRGTPRSFTRSRPKSARLPPARADR